MSRKARSVQADVDRCIELARERDGIHVDTAKLARQIMKAAAARGLTFSYEHDPSSRLYRHTIRCEDLKPSVEYTKEQEASP